MIRNPDLLRSFEADDDARIARQRSFEQALAQFTALWIHARQLDPHFGTDWRADLAPDIALARALNGLPPVT